MTWTCHVCGKERPDDKISVFSSTRYVGQVEMQQNVRYCNDKLECTKAAQDLVFMGTAEPT